MSGAAVDVALTEGERNGVLAALMHYGAYHERLRDWDRAQGKPVEYDQKKLREIGALCAKFGMRNLWPTGDEHTAPEM